MTPEQPSVRLDELLAHAGWVRRLAGSLVRDPAAADDLAQQTLVAAWQRPPGGDRPVRPWLAGVVRNLARQWWRSESRRKRRETSAAENERPLPGPDELASRLEIQQRLAALVAEMDEPLRGTVILRYYEGLSSAEIARRQDVPAGTVRWRLKKAMDLLRERLDGEHDGNRAAWVLLVAPLAEGLEVPPATATAPSPVAVTTAAGLTGGLVAMATTTKLALGAAVAVLLAVGVFAVSGPGAPDDATATAPEVANVSGDVAPNNTAEPAEVVIVDAEDPDAGTSSATTEDAAEVLQPVRLTARLVDEEGRGIAGGWIRSRLTNTPFSAKGDAGGRISAEVTLFERFSTLDLLVGARARATECLLQAAEADTDLDLGDIVLVPGGTVSGRIVDTLGNGIPEAWIGVSDSDWGQVDAFDGRLRGFHLLVDGASTRADLVGTFRLKGVPTGLQRLWAGKDGWRASPSDAVEVRAGGETVDVVLTLERERPEDYLPVRVVDPEGNPVPNAELRFRIRGENFTHQSSLQTDEEGRYRIPLHMAGTESVSLSATHPDNTWGPAGADDVRPDGKEVVLTLAELRFVQLHVTDPAGDPIPGVVHRIVVDSMPAFDSGSGEERSADGRIDVRIPAHRFRVAVHAPGHTKTEVGPWDPENAPGSLGVVLEPVPGVTGFVTDQGEPVPGAVVRLQEAVRAGDHVLHNNFVTKWYPAHATTTTGEDGAFRYDLRDDGRYVLRVEKEGFAPWVSGPMDLTARIGSPDHEVHLTEGGSIEGRVKGAPGQSVAGTIVGMNRGDGYARTVRVEADGRFRFDLLTPGDWEVKRAASLIGSGSSTSTSPGVNSIPWNCRVEDGTVTNFDLDLVEAEGATLEGELRIGAGSARGWKVALQDTGSLMQKPRTGFTSLATDGRFRLSPGGAGSFRLIMQSPDSSLMIWEEVDIAGVGSAWSGTLRLGSLTGSGAAANEMLIYVHGGGDGRSALAQIRADGEGHFKLEHALEGQGRICRVDRELVQSQPDPMQWPVLIEVDVKAGKTATVRVP